MKATFFCVLYLLSAAGVLPVRASAQDTPAAPKPPPGTTPSVNLKREDVSAQIFAGYRIEHPPHFFRAFFNHKNSPERGPGETEAAYRKRRLPLLEGQIYYFLVQRQTAKDGNLHENAFSYNPRDKTLMVYGGLALDRKIKDQARNQGVPILLDTVLGDPGNYGGAPPSGTGRTITEYDYTGFVFNIRNAEEFPPGVVDGKNNRVGLSMTSEGSISDGRLATREVAVLIGVSLADLGTGSVTKETFRPALDNAKVAHQTIVTLEVKLAEVLLINGEGQKLMKRIVASTPRKK